MEQILEYRTLASMRQRTVFLETSRPAADGTARSFLFQNPTDWLEARSLSDLPGLFFRIEAARAAGFWIAGYFSYECGYHWEPKAALGFVPSAGGLPLAAFGVYRQPVVFRSVSNIPGLAVGLKTNSFDIPLELFAHKVGQIRSYIEAGDTYQANLTGRLRASFGGDVVELFNHMMHAQPVEFGALLRIENYCILSASPELFFRLKGRHITVRPMKGTSKRGRDSQEDAERMQALANDEKNRAENVMIVDLMRNDLGRVAEMGSVQVKKLFEVEQFPHVLQMSTEITAVLRPEVTLYNLFASLFPSGSIVGAPKVRTMQILQEIEGRERGVYTGSIGFFSPDEEAVFSVAIRTAVLREGSLEMGVGAGITYDSTAVDEYRECLLKSEFLTENAFSLIETMRWENGHCALLPLHLARLEASAAYFGFRFSRATLAEAMEKATAGWVDPTASRLRLTLERDGTLSLSDLEPLRDEVGPSQAMLWRSPVQSSNRFLRHKTTRRELYDQALSEVRGRGYIDAIFQNENGVVTEGAIHNVLVRHGENWRTPPLGAGVLPGVYRAFLLKTMPRLVEAEFSTDDLLTADEVWMTNALRGVRVVTVDSSTPNQRDGKG
jgi:para-aminobenzoate synthetase / 4-amino-4-deoxychorismate lyase